MANGSNTAQQANSSKNTNKSAMPYDASYRDQLLNLQAQRATFFDELHRQQQALRRQFTQQQYDINQQKPYAFRDVLNNFAGRGMAFSTGYGNAQGRLHQQFAQQLARLTGDERFNLGQLASQKQTYLGNYNTQLDLLRRAATRRLSGNAGDMGLSY